MFKLIGPSRYQLLCLIRLSWSLNHLRYFAKNQFKIDFMMYLTAKWFFLSSARKNLSKAIIVLQKKGVWGCGCVCGFCADITPYIFNSLIKIEEDKFIEICIYPLHWGFETGRSHRKTFKVLQEQLLLKFLVEKKQSQNINPNFSNIKNKPAAQAAGADPSRCNSTDRQNVPLH